MRDLLSLCHRVLSISSSRNWKSEFAVDQRSDARPVHNYCLEYTVRPPAAETLTLVLSSVDLKLVSRLTDVCIEMED